MIIVALPCLLELGTAVKTRAKEQPYLAGCPPLELAKSLAFLGRFGGPWRPTSPAGSTWHAREPAHAR
ncbi:MAG: hypothetical protein WCK64_12010, partial [Synechococcaceae cyanobacterium ELA445]